MGAMVENAIARLATPAVVSRARRLASDAELLHVRRCRYDGTTTMLRARIDASSSWDESHRVEAVLEEDEGRLLEFACDCAPSRRMAGPCKHVVALVLDFYERPHLYEGYRKNQHMSTSSGIVRLMERVESDSAVIAGVSTEPGPGTVSLEPTLEYEAGFNVRFRVVGASGSYVMRSIGEFVGDVETHAYRSYGKHLAFVHDLEAFEETSRPLVSLLVRAVQNRRAYVFERVVGRGATGGPITPQRELHLSAPELWDLLASYEGRTLGFADHGSGRSEDAATHPMRVVNENPDMPFALKPEQDGSYVLACPQGIRIIMSGGRALAWDARTFYMCSPELSRNGDVLVGLIRNPNDPLVIAERDLPRFCAVALPRLEEAACVAVPAELEERRPRPCQLQFMLDRTNRGVTCEALAVYGEQRIPLFARRVSGNRAEGEGPSEQHQASQVPAEVIRDARTEARGREVVRRYFTVGAGGELFVPSHRGDALATLVFEGVGELQRLGTVLVTQSFERLRSKAHPRIRVGLTVRSNLLNLTLRLEGLPASELSGILSSYKLKRRFHRLRDGSFVDLSSAGLSEAGNIVDELGLDASELASGSVTLPAYHALVLEGVAGGPERDVSFDEYVSHVRSASLASYEVPPSLADVLRPYQAEGFQWLMALSDLGLGGILADEMGLGKSVQLISYLLATRDDARLVGPSLIVCPASLVYNWQEELAKFAPELNVVVVSGTIDERRELRQVEGTDVLVTSYDLARRDALEYARNRLWCLAIDEAQYIKNHETLAARAVKSLRAAHRVALTGTPVENRLSELWSLLDFLMPGLFGTYERFRERYERPIVEEEDQGASERLRRAVHPFVLRREKREVLRDLPEKIEQVVRARMDGRQRALYEAQVVELREHLSSAGEQGLAQEKLQILAMLTRLRQLCCDPQLLFEDYDDGSCKTETIMTLLDRALDARQKVLVFSQFTSYLDILSNELDRRGIPHFIITGSTSKRRRMELVEQFNDDGTPVFLISLKAGGTGLNLTGATVVVHADPWWNLAAQNQATDRAHRIGQTHDVTVYKVIASGTIEEHILELQRTKAQLAESVISGDATGVSLAQLTPEDLEELLG